MPLRPTLLGGHYMTLLTLQEAVARTHAPRHWFKDPRYRRRYRIPHLYVGARLRFPATALAEWLQQFRTEGR